jgi:hypothetical protein
MIKKVAKATKNNVQGIGGVLNDTMFDENKNVNENENQAFSNKIRMKIDKRLLEILKLPLNDFVLMPVS